MKTVIRTKELLAELCVQTDQMSVKVAKVEGLERQVAELKSDRDRLRGGDPRRILSESHWKQPLQWQRKAAREGRIIPVFPSMCDPFEDRAELDFPRLKLMELIAATPNLFWLLLTKRPGNAGPMLPVDMLPNLGLGVTVESPDYLWRVAKILEIPAALHFLSAEPLLSKLDLTCVKYRDNGREHCLDALRGEWASGKPGFPTLSGWGSARLGWVIAGCESGPKRRPTDIAHIRSLRDQAVSAGVPFMLKQMDVGGRLVNLPLLDGRQWNEFPKVMR